METESAFTPAPSSTEVNGHIEDQQPISQISHELEGAMLKDTQSTADRDSDLPGSGGTGEVPFTTSSQSAPDVADESEMKLDLPPIGAAPTAVQQPISDLREEVEPTGPERAADIKERKQHDDLIQVAETTHNAAANIDSPAEVPAAPDTSIDSIAPPIAQPSEPLIAVESTTESHIANNPTNTVSTNDSALEKSAEVMAEHVPNHPDVPVLKDSTGEGPLDPAPSPTTPAEIAKSAAIGLETSDQVMQDAPPLPAKMSRAREDDEEEEQKGNEPSAKRARTEDEAAFSTDFKIPERPTIDTDVNGSQIISSQATSGPMTKPRQKHLLKTIGNVKRIAAAKWFITPVDWEALKIPSYPTIVTRPMDLRTLEENLRAEKYSTVEAAVDDFNLIPGNARTFNGPEHSVTVQANILKASFDKAMEKMPGPEATEVNPSDKKKKPPSPGTVKIPPPRRESRSSLPGSARSPPASAASPQTFALGPEGVPLIRRDSTMTDRPKREIHKPAPRDLPYANSKPKKKKYQWELKFCEKVLAELSKPKYQALSYPFMVPVDPVALNIPTYFQVIKKPMDFSKIRENLSQGQYENAKEFEVDVRQVFKNCYSFNPPGDVIHQTGREFEKVFDSEWSQKRQWIENNTPASGPQSPGSSDAEESEDEEEEEEDEEEEVEQSNELTKLQQHIAALSKQVEMIQKKKKSPPVMNKKATKAAKPVKKEKKAAPNVPTKADKKAPKSKKEKIPYVTYEQKQDISERINMLPDPKMATALGIIRSGMPTLEGVEQDEIELDIDELNNEVLYKLLQFVRKHAPRQDDSPAPPKPKATSSSAAPARKKNKPMSKHEQEARIAQVQNRLSAYQQGNPPACKSRPLVLNAKFSNTLIDPQAEPSGEAEDDVDSEEDESSEEE